MALMTLPEYAKGLEKGDSARPYIEVFAASSDIAEVLPFEGFSGAAYEYYRQAEMPEMAFRAINEPPTSGSGKIEAFQEPSFPINHNLDVDIAIIRRHGMSRRAREEALGVARLGRLFANTFVSGDNSTQPREFNGIKKRANLYASDRVIHNSAASGGAALSLSKLDQMLNMGSFNYILAPRVSIPLFTAAARNTALTGFVLQSFDETGKPKMSYGGRRILFGYDREPEGDLTDFDEVASGGGAAVTASIYGLKLGEDGIKGIQLMDIQVDDKGLLEDNVTYRTTFAWDIGLVDEHPYSLARLDSITNAAIVA